MDFEFLCLFLGIYFSFPSYKNFNLEIQFPNLIIKTENDAFILAFWLIFCFIFSLTSLLFTFNNMQVWSSLPHLLLFARVFAHFYLFYILFRFIIVRYHISILLLKHDFLTLETFAQLATSIFNFKDFFKRFLIRLNVLLFSHICVFT